MISFTLFAALSLSIPSVSAVNYILDASCNGIGAVDRAIAEAKVMAGRADARLNSNDADIQAAFQQVYSTNTGDAGPVAEVRRIMSGVSQLTTTTVFDTSDVRIYCDEDARWTLAPDRTRFPRRLYPQGRPPNYVPNSQQPLKKQLWQDTVNGIRYKGQPGCRDGNTAAEVFGSRISTSQYSTLPAQRVTMTICRPDPPLLWNVIATVEEQGAADFTQVTMADVGIYELLSTTLMHEFTHISAFDTDDVEPNPYGWVNIIQKPTADAIRNADNYAHFGLLSLLGDKGFKLSTVNADAVAGILVSTTATYPKRMVNTIRSWARCKDRYVRARDPACQGIAGTVGRMVDNIGKI